MIFKLFINFDEYHWLNPRSWFFFVREPQLMRMKYWVLRHLLVAEYVGNYFLYQDFVSFWHWKFLKFTMYIYESPGNKTHQSLHFVLAKGSFFEVLHATIFWVVYNTFGGYNDFTTYWCDLIGLHFIMLWVIYFAKMFHAAPLNLTARTKFSLISTYIFQLNKNFFFFKGTKDNPIYTRNRIIL